MIRNVSQPLEPGYLVTNAVTGTSINGVNYLGEYNYLGGQEIYSTSASMVVLGNLASTNLTTYGYQQFFPGTVGSLPAAGSSLGEMRGVNDSTTIVTEGQTCVGGNSTPPNHALAFSNGSVWKCF